MIRIPLQGFGTFQSDSTVYPAGTAKHATLIALKTGYRHIDTAYAYGNGQIEREVGEAIRESGVPRNELFIVTKLHNTFHDPADVGSGLDMSLSNLDLDYVSNEDSRASYLPIARFVDDIRHLADPYAYAKGPGFSTLRRPDGSGKPLMDLELSRRYPDTWRAMAALINTGKTRAIGLSNFNILKMKRLMCETGIVPAANQVELNPYFPQFELVDFCRANGIQIIAHCPLGGALAPAVANRAAATGPLEDPTIRSIAATRDKTPAQVVLAWLTARGISVVPKSARPSRIQSNFDILFPLSEDEDTCIKILMGPHGERGIRNMVNSEHIGFDVFDEKADQPV